MTPRIPRMRLSVNSLGFLFLSEAMEEAAIHELTNNTKRIRVG